MKIAINQQLIDYGTGIVWIETLETQFQFLEVIYTLCKSWSPVFNSSSSTVPPVLYMRGL